MLVQNIGHQNFNYPMLDLKGFSSSASFNGQQLPPPRVCSLQFEQGLPTLRYPLTNVSVSGPAFYKGSLFINGAPADTWINMRGGWQSSQVWINGFHLGNPPPNPSMSSFPCLGRFWCVGPQFALYVPAPYLLSGRNEVVIYERLAPSADLSVTFQAQPDFVEKH